MIVTRIVPVLLVMPGVKRGGPSRAARIQGPFRASCFKAPGLWDSTASTVRPYSQARPS